MFLFESYFLNPDGRTDGQTDRQIDRQTDRQTHIFKKKKKILPVVDVGKNKRSQYVVETSETGCQFRNKTLT